MRHLVGFAVFSLQLPLYFYLHFFGVLAINCAPSNRALASVMPFQNPASATFVVVPESAMCADAKLVTVTKLPAMSSDNLTRHTVLHLP